MRGKAVVAWAVLLLAGPLSLLAGESRLVYPETKRVDVVDDYHGTPVADPYRWLEEDVRRSEDVRRWVEAQNEITFGYLGAIPERDAIHRRLEEIWNYERFTSPFKVAGRYYRINQNQSGFDIVFERGGLTGSAVGNVATSLGGRFKVGSQFLV